MKRFLRILLSWGFLKFLLLTITLVVLLYAEEDWRGARAWAATKSKWEARGVSFDFNQYIPPPVPDNQNLAALPLFKLEPDPDPDPENNGYLVPLALRKARENNSGKSSPTLSGLADWEHGKTANMEKLRSEVAAQFTATFPGRTPPATALEQFGQIYPFVGELREASKTRPYFRFAQNYDFIDHPKESSFGLMTDQIAVSKFLTWDAALALDAHQTDQALDDIKLNTKLTRSLMGQPVLVAGLVAIGMTAVNLGAVYDGLTAHQWSDAQLAEIQRQLAQLDFLAAYPHNMSGECLLAVRSFDEMLGHRYGPNSADTDTDSVVPLYFANGWIDLLKAQVADFQLTQIGYFDVNARRIDAKGLSNFMNDIAQRQRGYASLSLISIFYGIAAGPVTNAAWKYSEMQVWVDEARIACALERYRLAHHAYPPTLDALVPACLDDLPHDVMNGQPYHYRLNPDGTALLYSVGWNQRDDGGLEAKKEGSSARDYNQGDWPWPILR